VKAENKPAYDAAMKDLDSGMEDLKASLARLRDAGEDAWQKAETDLHAAIAKVRAAISDAKAKSGS
jgi:hypothetical protein